MDRFDHRLGDGLHPVRPSPSEHHAVSPPPSRTVVNSSMRFRLRTLLILLAIGPPVLVGMWWIRSARPDALKGWLWLIPLIVFVLCGVNCIVHFERPEYQHRKQVQLVLIGSAGILALAWLLLYLWVWLDYRQHLIY